MLSPGWIALAAWFVVGGASVFAREVGKIFPKVPYEQGAEAVRDYEAAPDALKWRPGSSGAPTSWAEAGLKNDARFLFSDAWLDGGGVSFCFGDSAGRYFVFCLEAPTRDGRDGSVKKDGVRRFHAGVRHPSYPTGIVVEPGSEADRFLIAVLERAAKENAPPSPPCGEGWDALRRNLHQERRTLTSAQRTELRVGFGGLYPLQGHAVDSLRGLETDALIQVLTERRNPLRKGESIVVVVALPLWERDDRLELVGYEVPGKFYFEGWSKAAASVVETDEWMFFFLPIAPVTASTSGFSWNLNAPRFRMSETPEGYRTIGTASSATGRRFE